MAVAPRLVDNAALTDLIGKVTELAVLPHVVFKVLELSGSDDFPTSQMEKAIAVDPGFSSRLLTIANSSFYALPRKVNSICEAISFLGFRAVRQLAMAVGVFDVFVGKNDADSLRRRDWWRHAVDTAICAKWVSEKFSVGKPDEAYTAGLLHSIGKSLLDRFGEGQYKHVEELVVRGAVLIGAERAVFGCDHVEVAAAASGKWGFPDSLRSDLLYSVPLEPNAPRAKERAIVALSTMVAELAAFGLPDGVVQSSDFLPVWALETIGLTREQAEEMVAGGKQAIADAATLRM